MTSLSYERAKGYVAKYDVLELGYNYRMDDIRGALIVEQLKKLEADIRQRKELRAAYIEMLMKSVQLIIPYERDNNKSSNYIFPVVLNNYGAQRRDVIRNRLAESGVETSVHYPAVHRFSIYDQFTTDLPKTDYVTDNEITLPLFPALSFQEVQFISTTLLRSVE